TFVNCSSKTQTLACSCSLATQASGPQGNGGQSVLEMEREKELFVETDSYRDALDKMNTSGIVVITGPPGSGKTSLGRALLRHYHSQNYQPLVLRHFVEWRSFVGGKNRKQIVLLENIVGAERLDQERLREWSDVTDMMRALAKTSQCLVVLTSYSHILHETRSQGHDVFSTLPRVDMGNTTLDDGKKTDILRNQLSARGKTLSESELTDILRMDKTAEVFPWCCALYAEKDEAGDAKPDQYFTNPAMAYVPLFQRLFHSKEDRQESIDMCAVTLVELNTLTGRLGEIPLREVPTGTLKRLTENCVGVCVVHNSASFTCRVFYDAIGLALGQSIGLCELLDVCDTRFLTEHVHTETTSSLVSLCVEPGSEDFDNFIDRIYRDITKGNLMEVSQHPFLQLVRCFNDLEVCCKRRGRSILDITTTLDKRHKLPLLYWSVFTSSEELFTRCLPSTVQAVVSGQMSKKVLVQVFFASVIFKARLLLLKEKECACLLEVCRSPITVELPCGSHYERDVANTRQKQCPQHTQLTEKYFLDTSVVIPPEFVTMETTDTALHLVLRCKSRYLALRLLGDKEQDERDVTGKTLLQQAVEAGDLNLVKFLVHQGATLFPDRDSSIFVAAYRVDQMDIAKYLFSINSDVTFLCGGVKKLYDLLHTAVRQRSKQWFLDLVRNCPCLHEVNNSTTLLHVAVNQNDTDVVIFLTTRTGCANATDQNGSTALFVACKNGNKKIAATLLKCGADANVINKTHETPLHVLLSNTTQANCRKRLSMIKLLLQNMENVDAICKQQVCCLHIAIKRGLTDVVKTLIKHKANVNVTDGTKQTPLHLSVAGARVDIATYLLEHGAQVNSVTDDGQTPLYQACFRDNIDIVRTLIDHGADVNAATKDGFTPLHITSKKGNYKVAMFLINKGSQVNSVTDDGRTPLYEACLTDHVDIVRTLVDDGADVNAATRDGFTPLHIASKKGHHKIAMCLITKGAQVNSVTDDGQTPLYQACFTDNVDIVRTLINHGADVNAAKKNGSTPLHIASTKGHYKVVMFLINKGSQVNSVTDDGRTPLYQTCFTDNVDIVRTLVDHGADVNTATKDGFTPLHIASQEGHCEVARFLITMGAQVNGADVNAATKDGFTPLHIASHEGHCEVTMFLINKGAQ
ncbi:hypothetical protein BaRGS_00040558, partial [Batillaria attramentaria]